MTESLPHRPPRHRGIYLLPNLFTTGALFSGFYAIVAGIGGHFSAAAIAVFIAALLDSMDGRVARLTHTQTDFGVQYDSLSDLVSFGLAPALVMYTWSLHYLGAYGSVWGKLGWAAAFIYAACAALRLARFNTQVGVADKRWFQGLASPASAGVCMAFVWAVDKRGISGETLCFVTPFFAIIAGLLMVSRVRYTSFKARPENDKVTFLWIIAAVLILVLLAIDTADVLLVVLGLYVISGLVLTAWAMGQRRRRRRHSGKPQG
ncbi:MAG TPA: CDP-alcohol phosphatidyltransferase family protein [Rhodanobacteraceae bacterium]